MATTSVIGVLIVFSLFLGLGLLILKMSNKRKTCSLWNKKHEDQLRLALNEIDSAEDQDSVKAVFRKIVKRHLRYWELLYYAKQVRLETLNAHLCKYKNFEQRERKAKRIWLFAFYFYALLLVLGSIITSLGMVAQIEETWAKVIVVSCFVAIFGIGMWLIYHCAYINRGTRMLAFLGGTSLISLNELVRNWNALDEVMIFINGFIIFYAMSCLLLYTINFEAKARQQLGELRKAPAPLMA